MADTKRKPKRRGKVRGSKNNEQSNFIELDYPNFRKWEVKKTVTENLFIGIFWSNRIEHLLLRKLPENDRVALLGCLLFVVCCLLFVVLFVFVVFCAPLPTLRTTGGGRVPVAGAVGTRRAWTILAEHPWVQRWWQIPRGFVQYTALGGKDRGKAPTPADASRRNRKPSREISKPAAILFRREGCPTDGVTLCARSTWYPVSDLVSRENAFFFSF